MLELKVGVAWLVTMRHSTVQAMRTILTRECWPDELVRQVSYRPISKATQIVINGSKAGFRIVCADVILYHISTEVKTLHRF